MSHQQRLDCEDSLSADGARVHTVLYRSRILLSSLGIQRHGHTYKFVLAGHAVHVVCVVRNRMPVAPHVSLQLVLERIRGALQMAASRSSYVRWYHVLTTLYCMRPPVYSTTAAGAAPSTTTWYGTVETSCVVRTRRHVTCYHYGSLTRSPSGCSRTPLPTPCIVAMLCYVFAVSTYLMWPFQVWPPVHTHRTTYSTTTTRLVYFISSKGHFIQVWSPKHHTRCNRCSTQNSTLNARKCDSCLTHHSRLL